MEPLNLWFKSDLVDNAYERDGRPRLWDLDHPGSSVLIGQITSLSKQKSSKNLLHRKNYTKHNSAFCDAFLNSKQSSTEGTQIQRPTLYFIHHNSMSRKKSNDTHHLVFETSFFAILPFLCTKKCRKKPGSQRVVDQMMDNYSFSPDCRRCHYWFLGRPVIEFLFSWLFATNFVKANNNNSQEENSFLDSDPYFMKQILRDNLLVAFSLIFEQWPNCLATKLTIFKPFFHFGIRTKFDEMF